MPGHAKRPATRADLQNVEGERRKERRHGERRRESRGVEEHGHREALAEGGGNRKVVTLWRSGDNGSTLNLDRGKKQRERERGGTIA